MYEVNVHSAKKIKNLFSVHKKMSDNSSFYNGLLAILILALAAWAVTAAILIDLEKCGETPVQRFAHSTYAVAPVVLVLCLAILGRGFSVRVFDFFKAGV